MHVLGVAAPMAGDLAEARDVMSRRIALARHTGNLYLLAGAAGLTTLAVRNRRG